MHIFEIDLRIRTVMHGNKDKPISLDSSFNLQESGLKKLLKVVSEESGLNIELKED